MTVAGGVNLATGLFGVVVPRSGSRTPRGAGGGAKSNRAS